MSKDYKLDPSKVMPERHGEQKRCMELWEKKMRGEITAEEFTRQLGTSVTPGPGREYAPEPHDEKDNPFIRRGTRENPRYFND